jgi:hypothetical protein
VVATGQPPEMFSAVYPEGLASFAFRLIFISEIGVAIV